MSESLERRKETPKRRTQDVYRWRRQDFKKGGAAASKIFERKPHPLIMMSLLSLPEGVTTKNEKH